MIIIKTLTKKFLEDFIQETYLKFGSISCSALLDSLKLIGFFYATNAAISINIEDLKTPQIKKHLIQSANNDIFEKNKKWSDGAISNNERFQTIIDSWNNVSEILKTRIIDFYKNYDPTNNLYIMAFSGARGNISQVRQLVGMRGLMADQNGKIIDLPIQTNFREGLNSIDYIISSYGARKGIVDTALKTADSGYLTRRLIYIAQDLIIREKDCKTSNGLIFLLKRNSNIKNLIGRTLLSIESIERNETNYLPLRNLILTDKILNDLKQKESTLLNIRSPLTCLSFSSICQYCYGWNLAKSQIIGLGETVGVIAAQSIGEPGTQLTMRTFHTGGIFTGELLKQIKSPFSGKIIVPENIKFSIYRTAHGIKTFKIKQEVTLTLINWKGETISIGLSVGSFLYINRTKFIKKNELLAEQTTQSVISNGKNLKPIYANFSGEIRFENLFIRNIILADKKTIKLNQNEGSLVIAACKKFSISKEAKLFYLKKVNSFKPFSLLKLITPYEGIFVRTKNIVSLMNFKTKYYFNLLAFYKSSPNLKLFYCFFPKNYQYLDSHSIISQIYFYTNLNEIVYGIRKKEALYYTTYFLITTSDIWTVNSDTPNTFLKKSAEKNLIKLNSFINSNSKTSKNGIFIRKNGFKFVFQKIFPLFLNYGTILNKKHGDFINNNEIIATLVNYVQQTEDIVQGLPKIEELVEIRKPKIKTILASQPGIFLDYINLDEQKNWTIINKNLKLISTSVSQINSKNFDLNKLIENCSLLKSLSIKNNFKIIFNQLFNQINLPKIFKLERYSTSQQYVLYNKLKQIIVIKNNINFSLWTPLAFDNVKIYNTLTFKSILFNRNKFFIFYNKIGDLLLLTDNNEYLYFERTNPFYKLEIPVIQKFLIKKGNFVDLGEPLTDGNIDINELLFILYNYQIKINGCLKGTSEALAQFQLILVHSLQSIYQSQGVLFSSKHVEIIAKQMTSSVEIETSGDAPLLPGEIIKFSTIKAIYNAFNKVNTKILYQTPKFQPVLRSITNSSLNKDGFLSSSGFQETKRILTKAAIEGSTDWLRGLKESIIVGRLIPSGSVFLNYKNYLDILFDFKNI